MDKMDKIKQLMRYINLHCIPCVYSPQRNKIRAICRYSCDGDDGNELEDIEPTIQAVRDWLGY